MKYLHIIAVWAFVVFMISGCGGSGSGSSPVSTNGEDSTPTSEQSSTPLTTSTIRQYTQGDTWNYKATGSISNGIETVDLNGTVKVQILSTLNQSPITLDNCLDEYVVITLSDGIDTVAITSHSYFLQDEDGSVYEYGEDGEYSDVWVDSPLDGYFRLLQSPFAVGKHDELSISYTDDSMMIYSYSIGDIEKVSTDIGIFDAYTILIDMTYYYPYSDDMCIVTTKNWYVPNIGTMKVSSVESYYADNVLDLTFSYTATLSHTTVPF